MADITSVSHRHQEKRDRNEVYFAAVGSDLTADGGNKRLLKRMNRNLFVGVDIHPIDNRRIKVDFHAKIAAWQAKPKTAALGGAFLQVAQRLVS